MSIYEAIEQNDIDYVRKYIEEGGNVNARNDNNQTLLMRACQRNRYEIVKLLIEHPGIDITLDDGQPYHQTGFYYAIAKDKKGSHQQIIDALFQSKKLSQRDKNLALIYYVGLGDQAKVKACIEEYDCDINYSEMNMGTPLIQAVVNNQLDIIKLLLSYSTTEINKTNDLNDTALIVAARLGRTEIVTYLLKYPTIDLHIQSYLYGTALTSAIWAEEYEAAKILLEKEENYDGKKHPGALLWAVKNDALEMIQLLVNKGAKVDSDGSEGYKDVPTWVWEEGYASPFACKGPPVFELPIIVALEQERLKVLPFLLKKADLNKIGAWGDTALQIINKKRLSEETQAVVDKFFAETYASKKTEQVNSGQLITNNGLFKNNIVQSNNNLSSIAIDDTLSSGKYLVVNLTNISQDKKNKILKFFSEMEIQPNIVNEEMAPEIPKYQVVK